MTPPLGLPVPFENMVAHLLGDRSIALVPSPPGPPKRVDGTSIGVLSVTEGPGPHRGELHPDGDELLYVFAGSMVLVLDDGDRAAVGTETIVPLGAGDVYVVPRGTWHRLEANEPSCLLHVTPGPGGDFRPR